ncbi:ribonuclease Z, partial [Clostridium saudiense]|nr:ribonuclease Z [Clostridium saudiense]
MHIVVCLDDNNGMMFNKRRQSQDKLLRADISNSIGDSNLFMNHYSYKLYKDIDNGKVQICDDFLNKCGVNDFCLVEDKSLSSY